MVSCWWFSAGSLSCTAANGGRKELVSGMHERASDNDKYHFRAEPVDTRLPPNRLPLPSSGASQPAGWLVPVPCRPQAQLGGQLPPCLSFPWSSLRSRWPCCSAAFLPVLLDPSVASTLSAQKVEGVPVASQNCHPSITRHPPAHALSRGPHLPTPCPSSSVLAPCLDGWMDWMDGWMDE